MKKIAAILIAFAVILSAISISTINAFAQTTTKYWEPMPNAQGASGYVNGEPDGDEIYIVADTENDASRIEYLGEGKVKNWEFPTLTEEKDYKIISQYDNVIIVKFSAGCPYINAVVDFGDETVKQESTESVQPKNSETVSSAEADETASKDNDGFIKDDSMQLTADLKADSSAKKAEPNGTKTVIIAVSAGAAVCIAVLAAVKIKKSNAK